MDPTTATPERLEFRPHDWFDAEAFRPVYGVQVRLGKGARWMHCAKGGKPLFFNTEAERADEMARLRSRASDHV